MQDQASERVDVARKVWRQVLKVKREWDARRVRAHRTRSNETILRTPPAPIDPRSPIEIHALTCERDYADLLWCLKTFFHYADRCCRVVLHDDGSLSRVALEHLERHLPGATIITKADIDGRMHDVLRSYEGCRSFRNRLPLARRLFDFPTVATSDRFLVLDSDVLFFRRPEQMLRCIDQGCSFFMSDYQDGYVFPRADIAMRYGVDVFPAFNTGIAYLPRQMFDFDFIERYCRDVATADLLGHPWAEQTLFAMLLSRCSHGAERLPDVYRISRQPIDSDTISHHFVNDGSRGLFYTHGVRRLRRAGFLVEYDGRFGRRTI